MLVTGAGSGIGRCTAHELAALGASLALAGRGVDKLGTVAAEIAEAGARASCHPVDIRDEDAVSAAVGGVPNARHTWPARAPARPSKPCAF